MGYESYLRKQQQYRSQVGTYVFEFESSRRFQFSFTDFSLVYRSAFAQICISKVTAHESIQYL
jgi:hypothetical protein